MCRWFGFRVGELRVESGGWGGWRGGVPRRVDGVIIQGGEVEVVGRGGKGDGPVISGIVVEQEQ